MWKTTFLEKLGLNNFFRKIVKADWISGIDIDKKREAKIQSYFSNETEVHVAKEQDELDSLIETFKLRSREETTEDNVNISFGENKKLDQLIILDDVSGVADISKKMQQFLENLVTIASMYFTLLFQQVKFGKKLILKRIYLTFFLLVFCIALLQKLFKVIALHKVKNMFLHVHFDLIGLLLI